MKLYVCNCTHQKHLFNFKLIEKNQLFSKEIGAGQQVFFDLNKDDVEYVIKQHERYGFADVKSIDNDFSGICYSVDKEINLKSINSGSEQVKKNLSKKSEKIRKEGAVAMEHTLSKAAQAGGLPADSGMQITVEGEAIDQSSPNAPKFKETIEVKR